MEPIKAVLIRNNKIIQMVVTDGNPYFYLEHLVNHDFLLNLEVPVQCFKEIFERNLNFGSCPCCGVVVYNSKNWIEAPKELLAKWL